MAELTGPNNCAECGRPTPLDMAEAGDAGALVIPINGDMVEVPGLYVCTDCAGSVMVGEREATVTPERAVKFLTETYIPILASFMTHHKNEFAIVYSRFMDCKKAAEKLDPDISVELGVIELD